MRRRLSLVPLWTGEQCRWAVLSVERRRWEGGAANVNIDSDRQRELRQRMTEIGSEI